MGFGVSQTTVLAIKERTDRLPDAPADQVTSLAVKARTDNLAGSAPVTNAVIANWNSGVAPSGLAGAQLVSLGALGVRNKVHSLIVRINLLTPGANITVRLYTSADTGEGICYNQSFVVGTDPNLLWIINGTVEIDDVLRVECQSDQGADDGLAIGYKYDLEAM